MNSDFKLLFGIALAATVGGVIMANLEKGAVESGMREARDALFDVAPDCSTITFKGGGDAPDPAALNLAKQYYFVPFVKAYLPGAAAEADILDVTVVEFLTAKMLYQLFPECNVDGVRPWPSTSVWDTGFGIWFVMLAFMAELVAQEQGN